MATNTAVYVALLAIALCAAVAFCPIVLADDGEETVLDTQAEVSEETTEVTAPEFRPQMDPAPDFDGERPELTYETVTLEDGTEIQVPLLPNGELPNMSEDGTMVGPQGMPGMPGQGPQGMPEDMDVEMDGEEFTFTNDDGEEVTIFVPYLPDGTLPAKGEGAAPGENAPQMNGQNGPQGMPGQNGEAPSFDGENAPQMDGQAPQGMPGQMGPQMNGQSGPMGMPGQMGGQGAPAMQ